MTPVSRRSAERWTAVAVAIFGGVAVLESLTHDIGWNPNGPGPGYFPFRVGLLLIAASLVIFLEATRSRAVGTFVTRAELGRSLSVFLPTVGLVAGMFALGCYVPSAIYLTWMMRAHGGYGWARSAASGAAVMVVFFLIFDLWFRVPLAKGPVEALLGIY